MGNRSMYSCKDRSKPSMSSCPVSEYLSRYTNIVDKFHSTWQKNEDVPRRLVSMYLPKCAHGCVNIVGLADSSMVYLHGVLSALDIHYLRTDWYQTKY